MAKLSKPIDADPIRKAIAYARVSSKEQEKEGFSIPAQLKLLNQTMCGGEVFSSQRLKPCFGSTLVFLPRVRHAIHRGEGQKISRDGRRGRRTSLIVFLDQVNEMNAAARGEHSQCDGKATLRPTCAP
jgi:hypothetical protein